MERRKRNDLTKAKQNRTLSPPDSPKSPSYQRSKSPDSPTQPNHLLSPEEIKHVLKELGKMRRLIKKHSRKKSKKINKLSSIQPIPFPENQYEKSKQLLLPAVSTPALYQTETPFPQSVTYSSANCSTMPTKAHLATSFHQSNPTQILHSKQSSYIKDPKNNSVKIWLDDAVMIPQKKRKKKKKRRATGMLKANDAFDSARRNSYNIFHKNPTQVASGFCSPQSIWSSCISPMAASNNSHTLKKVYGQQNAARSIKLKTSGSSNVILKKFKPRCAVGPSRKAIVPFFSINVDPENNTPYPNIQTAETTKNNNNGLITSRTKTDATNIYNTLSSPRFNQDKSLKSYKTVREIETQAAKIIQKQVRKWLRKLRIKRHKEEKLKNAINPRKNNNKTVNQVVNIDIQSNRAEDITKLYETTEISKLPKPKKQRNSNKIKLKSNTSKTTELKPFLKHSTTQNLSIPIQQRHAKSASKDRKNREIVENIASIESFLQSKLALRDKRKNKKYSRRNSYESPNSDKERREMSPKNVKRRQTLMPLTSEKSTPVKKFTTHEKTNQHQSEIVSSQVSSPNQQTLSLSFKPGATISNIECESNAKSSQIEEHKIPRYSQTVAVGTDDINKDQNNKIEFDAETFDHPAVLQQTEFGPSEPLPVKQDERTPTIRRPSQMNIMTPQFSNDEPQAFKNVTENSELYEYSKNDSNLDPNLITFKVMSQGQEILWSLYLDDENSISKSNTENENTDFKNENDGLIKTELMAVKVGSWDVLACRNIKFYSLINDPKNNLQGWGQISILIPTCLGIFKALSQNAPEFRLTLWQDSVEQKNCEENSEIPDIPLNVQDEYIKTGIIKPLLTSDIDIESIIKSLTILESSYPRCDLQIRALENISELATWNLVRKLENAKGKRLGVGAILEFFSKEIVQECLQEISHLFVYMRDYNGKKLTLSRNAISEISFYAYKILIKKCLTYRDLIYGNNQSSLEKMNSKSLFKKKSLDPEKSGMPDHEIFLNSNNNSVVKSNSDSHGFSSEHGKLSSKLKFDTSKDLNQPQRIVESVGNSRVVCSNKHAQNNDEQEVSSEESMDYKNILEPMQKFVENKEEQEKLQKAPSDIPSYSTNEHREILSQEVEQIQNYKNAISSLHLFKFPFFKEYFSYFQS